VCTYNNNNFKCQAGGFVITVTGNQNVPFFTFYLNSTTQGSNSTNSSSSSQYTIKLMHLYEATNTGGKLQMVGGSMIALPSLTWSFSTPMVVQRNWTSSNGSIECHQETTFNVTNNGQDKKSRWSNLVFVNHLRNQDTNDRVKFDVVLEDYQWVSTTNTTVLALDASLLSSNPSQNSSLSVNNNTNTVNVGSAYFNATNWANIQPQNVNVSVNITSDGSNNGFSLIYSHFPTGSSLYHDPEFGLSSSSNNTNNNDNNMWIWIGVGVGGVLVIVAVAVVLFLYMRHRKKKYETLI
jgi:hypothetical protein